MAELVQKQHQVIMGYSNVRFPAERPIAQIPIPLYHICAFTHVPRTPGQHHRSPRRDATCYGMWTERRLLEDIYGSSIML